MKKLSERAFPNRSALGEIALAAKGAASQSWIWVAQVAVLRKVWQRRVRRKRTRRRILMMIMRRRRRR